MKKPNHRIFDFTPQHYDPQKDEIERKKKKLNFRSQLKANRRNKRSPLLWIIILVGIILVYLKLKGWQ